jgi:hypothetical protein
MQWYGRYVSSTPPAYINLANLRSSVGRAYEQAIIYLLQNTLPSIWSDSGLGWQEHWGDAPAGFYASCDGISMLVAAVELGLAYNEEAIETLIKRVYDDHLCMVLTNTVAADTSPKRNMRLACAYTTQKLAKFVQASASYARIAEMNLDVANRARQSLISVAKQSNELWSARVDASKWPSLTATCEGLIALAAMHDDDVTDIIHDGASLLLKQIEINPDKRRRVASIWALSEILPYLSQALKSKTVEHAQYFLQSIAIHEDDEVTEFFNNSLGNGDYYHLNTRLLGAKSILRLHSEGYLTRDYLRFAISVVESVATTVNHEGFYAAAEAGQKPRFWETFQAVSVLAEYIKLLDKRPNLRDEGFMWIDPKHFDEKNFVTEPDLAVVLMPFDPEWSGDLFDVFKNAANNRKFRAWRSDLQHGDDKIMQTIWNKINRSRFVIADCTGRNPNVFYELGIAHSVGKPVFICAQNREDIPFDISAIRSHAYGNPIPSQLKKLEGLLEKFIDEL